MLYHRRTTVYSLIYDAYSFFMKFLVWSKQQYASIYHYDSRLRIKKAPAPKRLPQCPMWPYYRVFHDFACLRFLSKNFKSIYHCVSPKLQHPGGLQISSCLIIGYSYFCDPLNLYIIFVSIAAWSKPKRALRDYPLKRRPLRSDFHAVPCRRTI